jgi:hypothetical protein
MALHYATQLYHPHDWNHYQRLLDCLKSNLRFSSIQQATVFLNNCDPPWQHPKVSWRRISQRASFSDFLELADLSHINIGEPQLKDHLLFANSDIIFTSDPARLAVAVTHPDWALCLTRRELDGAFPGGCDPQKTQDAWMLMQQPLHPQLLDQLRSIGLGVAGCDNLFAAVMIAHGFRLWNPCHDFYILHNDPYPVARWSNVQRYFGLYAYVPACRLEDVGWRDSKVSFAFAKFPGSYKKFCLDE